MNRITSFIRKNHNRFIFSLCINTIVAIVFNVFFYCRFHTVDDVFMEMNGCGAFGTPDAHLIYINYIIGFLISRLYILFESFPWYGMMHIIMSILSLSCIMYVFMNDKNIYSKIIVIFIIFIISYEAYTKIQFTKTAAYLATAGYLLIASSFNYEKRILKQIVGIVFIWCSFMMRTGMFLGCSAVCAGCFIPMIIEYFRDIHHKKNMRKIINLALVGFCSLVLVLVSIAIDRIAYSSDEWAYYRKYNEYTTQFEDINFPSYELYEKQYLDLGISYDDYRLYGATDINDPELFGMDKMEKVKSLQPYKTIDSNEIVMFALRGYNTLFKQKTLAPFSYTLIMIVFVYIFFCKKDINGIIAILYTCFAALLVFAYTYFMHGWFDRTTIAVMSSLLLTLLYICQIKDIKYAYPALIIMLIIGVALSLLCWSNHYKWNAKNWKEEYAVNQEVLDYIYNDKSHLYISRTSLPLWKRYYTPYDIIKPGAMDNYAPLGDWLTNTPLSIDTLRSFGVTNPYKDMVNNENVYFIGNEDGLNPVVSYLQRHYYKNVNAVIINNLGMYNVYSITGNNDQ